MTSDLPDEIKQQILSNKEKAEKWDNMLKYYSLRPASESPTDLFERVANLEQENRQLKELNQLLCDGQGELELKYQKQLERLKTDLSAMKKCFNMANTWRNENLDKVNDYQQLKEAYEAQSIQFNAYYKIVERLKTRIAYLERIPKNDEDFIFTHYKMEIKDLREILGEKA